MCTWLRWGDDGVALRLFDYRASSFCLRRSWQPSWQLSWVVFFSSLKRGGISGISCGSLPCFLTPAACGNGLWPWESTPIITFLRYFAWRWHQSTLILISPLFRNSCCWTVELRCFQLKSLPENNHHTISPFGCPRKNHRGRLANASPTLRNYCAEGWNYRL